MTTEAPPKVEQRIQFEVRGANRELLYATDDEILISGSAGTGKTASACWLLRFIGHSCPGARMLMVRKTKVSLTSSAVQTLRSMFVPADGVSFFGGNDEEPASFRFKNGSTIELRGMDDPERVKSTDYDFCYVNEVNELAEEEWEMLTTRLGRHFKPDGLPYVGSPRIIGDCNPTNASHWLLRRVQEGKLRHLVSHIEDNPLYFDADGEITAAGRAYVGRLDRLSGLMYQRLRLGLWTGIENSIYDNFDPEVHMIDLPEGLRFIDAAGGVDYGSVHHSSVCAVKVDQYHRRWVFESWAEADTEHGERTLKAVGQLRRRHLIRRWRVDPNQDVLVGKIGARIARLAERNRQARIDKTHRLWDVFPGGMVYTMAQEAKGLIPHGPFTTPDSPGLFIVKGCPGGAELAAEISGYQYLQRHSAASDKLIVDRRHEDRVAAMENANEELEMAPPPMPTLARFRPDPRPAPVMWRRA